MFPHAHPSLNQLWAELLIEELCRRGIRHCCLAPGSRSTPLVLAVARRPALTLHHHLDERGLGFMALGLAKTCREPVAVITTSGTAVANLYPAVIEATLTGAQLLLLTADRPPRLQDCGANQAITQPGLFADYPRQVLNLDPPSEQYPANRLLQQFGEGLDAIAGPAGGVFHLNCRYDEPLYPDGRLTDYSAYLAPLGSWLNHERPLQTATHQHQSILPDAAALAAFVDGPGLIVAGTHTDAACSAIKALAEQLGWPVVADIQSPLKFEPGVLGLADLLLGHPEARAALAGCTRLLQFGGRLVSKRLQQFIDQHPWQAYWVVHPGDYPLAPGRNHTAFFAAESADWCRTCLNQLAPGTGGRDPLVAINDRLVARLAERFAAQSALTELATSYRLLTALPSGSTLVAGNSLAIRLLDSVGGNLAARPRVIANRGASGIEGLVATAAGCVLAEGRPVTLLLGDTSLLYDLNSLMLLAKLPVPLVIVVLNNDGGGIFQLLPVPDEMLRQTHYQRPHGLDFADACRQFGIDYRAPTTPDTFVDQYTTAIHGSSSCLIEVRCDATETAAELRGLVDWVQG